MCLKWGRFEWILVGDDLHRLKYGFPLVSITNNWVRDADKQSCENTLPGNVIKKSLAGQSRTKLKLIITGHSFPEKAARYGFTICILRHLMVMLLF